jgi:quercetin dioxygenase-like cupin family protein
MEPPAAEDVIELLARLDPAFREKVIQDLVRIVSQHRPPEPGNDGSADAHRGNKSVTLSRWAYDRGLKDGRQKLEICVAPGPLEIPKTRAATGLPVLTNGFLGADIIYVPAGEGFAPHTHPGDHLLFVLAGQGTITASGEILETAPGQAYLVDGSSTHAVGAITDHMLLAIGASHRTIDSLDRQELRPFAELLADNGTMSCRICNVMAAGEKEFALTGCPHSPLRYC